MTKRGYIKSCCSTGRALDPQPGSKEKPDKNITPIEVTKEHNKDGNF